MVSLMVSGLDTGSDSEAVEVAVSSEHLVARISRRKTHSEVLLDILCNHCPNTLVTGCLAWNARQYSI
jgi:hypothetical protein